MIQIIGVLTNNHTYLDKTNVIGSILQDVWTYDGLSREQVKKALQPILYGSSAKPNELWDKNKLPYTQQQLNIVNDALDNGIYSKAKEFKDFIIGNVVPKKHMEVDIWNDTFMISCNRFKWEEQQHVAYPIYTSAQSVVKRVAKTVNLVPDLEQFKRYMITCLIHNLDSQIADEIANAVSWVLPNHDSFLVHPNDAILVKDIYVELLYQIYTNRKTILFKYFMSIGITSTLHDVDKKELRRENFLTHCLK